MITPMLSDVRRALIGRRGKGTAHGWAVFNFLFFSASILDPGTELSGFHSKLCSVSYAKVTVP